MVSQLHSNDCNLVPRCARYNILGHRNALSVSIVKLHAPSLIWQGSFILVRTGANTPQFFDQFKTKLNNTEFCKLCENLQFLRSSGEYAELVVLSKYGEHTVLELTVVHTVS